MSDIEINSEIIHKEIDLIEGCINRMAKNSFLIKGWVISLIGIVLAMIPKAQPLCLLYGCIILIVAIMAFWYLDAYYLQLENKYRKLYETVIPLRLNGESYALYNLNPNRFNNEVKGIGKYIFSSTLFIFYMSPIILLTICALYNSQYIK